MILSYLKELWGNEVEKAFYTATKKLLQHLYSEDLVLSSKLFAELYPELEKSLEDSRGWWNPLLSPFVVYHFYRQAILVLPPVKNEEEFQRTIKLHVNDIVRLIKEGLLIVLASAPQDTYECQCFERIAEAQGSFPTILRLTEPLKSILYALYKNPVYNTKAIYEMIYQEYVSHGLTESDVKDTSTRISDLASLCYKKLSESLLGEALKRPVIGSSIVRASHHILVEPIIDSGASIATYSKDDIGLIESVASSDSPLGKALAGAILSMGVDTRLKVPKKTRPDEIIKFVSKEEALNTYDTITAFKNMLHELNKQPENAISEAREIARVSASLAEQLNKHISTTTDKSLAVGLGFISQIPLSLIIPSTSLLELGISLAIETSASLAVTRATLKALEKLLYREETVKVVPVTPLIFEHLIST
jgi:hypothetical protein